MSELKISLFEPSDRKTWADQATDVLSSSAFRVEKRGHFRLDAWASDSAVPVGEKLFYVDGFQFDSSWLSERRSAVRVHPQRFYFGEREANQVLHVPEFHLLGDIKSPPKPARGLLEELVQVGMTLTDSGIFRPVQIAPETVSTGLVADTQGIGRNGEGFALEADLWRNLARTKVLSVPKKLKVILVFDDSEKSDVAATYRTMLEREWLPELGVHTDTGTIRAAGLSKVLPEIKRVKAGVRAGDFEDAVFLVAIEGKAGDRLPPAQEEFLSILDEMALPYRCFSTGNQQAKWSSRAQAVSVLEGAGGVPYRLSFRNADALQDALLIGVDIGHDTRNRRVSHVVVSVLDQHGKHVVSLRKLEPLNEALAADVVGTMLRHAKAAAEERLGCKARAAIIYRDGIIPTAGKRQSRRVESPEVYCSALGIPVTIIEFRKRGNPILYQKARAGYQLVAPGTSCAPVESDVRFMTAYAAPVGFPRVFKVRLVPGFDQLDIGIDNAAAITVGLCYSQSLGLKAHLPGPIYWADGIASTKEYSYKFAGQPVIDV